MTLLSDAVGIIADVTTDLGLQPYVTHRRMTGDSGKGDPVLKDERVRAVVSYRRRMVHAADGSMVESKASVTFASPRAVSPGDYITLPDGTRHEILAVDAPADESGRLVSEASL